MLCGVNIIKWVVQILLVSRKMFITKKYESPKYCKVPLGVRVAAFEKCWSGIHPSKSCMLVGAGQETSS